MNHKSTTGAVEAYRSVDAYGGVETADPHQLIQLLLDGALSAIRAARAHLTRGDLPAKAGELSRAVAIVDTLRGCLDHERGGDVAAGLEQLYDYLARRLTMANARNDELPMREAEDLLTEIRDAWAAVASPADSTATTDAVVG